jgi:hypothetical protein
MEIDLGGGKVALVDDEDWFAVRCNYRKDGTVDRVSPCELSWYLHDDKKGNVEVWSCYRRNGRANEQRYSMRLHRVIMECPVGMAVDHINGNRLDNRRCNLLLRERYARPNRRLKLNHSTPYKGVVKERNRFSANIKRNGVNRTVALCDTALEAALLYDDAARVEYGELARLNFPERKPGQEICLYDGARNGANSITRKRKVIPSFDGQGHTSIDLGRGFTATISDADWTTARKHYWNDGRFTEIAPCDVVWATHKNRSGMRYVQSTNGRCIRLHRLVTECPPGFVVDHIDGNPLNNTQENLRICTNEQNLRNTRKRKKTKHRFKGLCFVGNAKYAKRRYSFTIQANSRLYRGGKYNTALEAALAYDDMAIKLHAEFAGLNFPERHKATLAASR